MNTPILERYPFDYTGEAITNLVEGELHVIPPGKKDRIFTLLEGPGFSDSIKLFKGDGTPLTPWVDFQPVNYYPEASVAVSKPCTGMVMILNESFSGHVYATYQVVGGKYDHNSLAVVDLLWAAINDERPVFWVDIMGKPDMFPPSYHTHDIFLDTYAWDARIELVDVWTQEVLLKADSSHLQSVIKHIDVLTNHLNSRHAHALELIQGHTDTPAAHAETKEQAGLTLLDNIATASLADARAGQRYDQRLTVEGAEAILTDALDAYSANLMRQGILPISRWGNLTYLQAGVSGSFEGASQYQSHDAFAQCVEVDGTYMRLRPGINGQDVGLYYDYCTQIIDNATTANATFTNNKYAPASLDQAYVPCQLMNNDGNVLMGIMVRRSVLPAYDQKWFVSITNGTLDHTKHDCAELLTTAYTFPNGNTQALNSLVTCVFQAGNRMYVTVGRLTAGSSRQPNNPRNPEPPVEWGIGYINLDDIKTNSQVSITWMTGFSTTSYGITRNANTLMLALQYAGYPGEDCMMQYSGTFAFWSAAMRGWAFNHLKGTPNADGTITLNGKITGQINGPNNTVINQYYFRLKWNPVTNVVTVPGTLNRINFSGNGSGLIAQVTADNGSGLNKHNSDFGQSWDDNSDFRVSWIVTQDGYVINTMRVGASNDSNTLLIYKVVGFTTANAVMANPSAFTYTLLRVSNDYPPYGTAAQGVMRAPVLYPGNILQFVSGRTDLPSEWTAYQPLLGAPTYQYKSLNNGTLSGYRPTNNRAYAKMRYANRDFVTEINLAGQVTTHVQTPSTHRLTGETDYTPDLTPSGSMSITASDIEAQLVRLCAATGLTWTARTGSLIIPRDASCPVLFKMCGILTPESNGLVPFGVVVATVSYTGSRTAADITGWSINVNDFIFHKDFTGSTGVSLSQYVFGHILYQVNDGWLFALGGWQTISVTGPGAILPVMWGKVGADKRISNNPYREGNESPYGTLYGRTPIAFPGKGFYICDADPFTYAPYPMPNIYQSPGSCSITVRRAGATIEELVAYTDETLRNADTIVLLTHAVEQGWMVYFTEEVPIILNGREGTVPLTTINLTTVKANPANTTFYVYVEELNGVMSYRITDVEELPTIKKMFIGTIVTSDSAIGSINIAKRSRIGIYQVSDKNFGSSIPVSTGLPFQTGDWSMDT